MPVLLIRGNPGLDWPMMASIALALLLGAGGASRASAQSPISGASGAHADLELVRSELERRAAAFRSLKVAYRVVGEDQQDGFYLDCFVAFAPPAAYAAMAAHVTPRNTAEDDPFRHVFYIDDSGFCTFEPFSSTLRLFEIEPDAPLPGSYRTNLFVAATGCWPIANRPSPGGLNLLLGRGHDGVERNVSVERSNGAEYGSLVSFRWDSEEVTLIEDFGYAVLSRSLTLSRGKPLATVHYRNEDFVEVSEGAWLPRRGVRSTVLDGVETIDSYTVVEFEHDPTLLRDFRGRQRDPALLIIDDNGSSPRPVIGENASQMLEDQIDWYRRIYARSRPRNEPKDWWDWRVWGMAGVGTVVLALCLFRFRSLTSARWKDVE